MLRKKSVLGSISFAACRSPKFCRLQLQHDTALHSTIKLRQQSRMRDTFRLLFGTLSCFFRARRSLLLQNLALRQQLVVLKRWRPRPRLVLFDKLFWVVARRFWSEWKHVLLWELLGTDGVLAKDRVFRRRIFCRCIVELRPSNGVLGTYRLTSGLPIN